MRIIKRDKNVLLTNDQGQYHFSHEEFNRLGEVEAIKYAEKEIEKKSNTKHYTGEYITFKKARSLGLCEEGLIDFCEMLDIDIDTKCKTSDLKDMLTIDAFNEYPDECIKIFGSSVLDNFGGLQGYLAKSDTFREILREEFIPAHHLHELACLYAEDCLHIFEEKYPKDKRPRKAIEAKRLWLKGEISDSDLKEAWASARASARTSALTWASASARTSALASASASTSAWASARTSALALTSAWASARTSALALASARTSALARADLKNITIDYLNSEEFKKVEESLKSTHGYIFG